tara:strand:+ start:681 stop:1241 length:561 start_codon:yes stop_codon:yes gene_type:complete
MVKGKIVRKAADKVVTPALQGAKLGAGAAAVEQVVDIIDNPYIAAAQGAVIGGAAGAALGPVGIAAGATAGGLIGFVLNDTTRVMPCDMIAIPSYQYAAVLSGREPTFQILIKEGEMVQPILPTEYVENIAALSAIKDSKPTKRKRAKGAGLPPKYAKMGFKKGWREYKKTKSYKAKAARKKRGRR